MRQAGDIQALNYSGGAGPWQASPCVSVLIRVNSNKISFSYVCGGYFGRYQFRGCDLGKVGYEFGRRVGGPVRGFNALQFIYRSYMCFSIYILSKVYIRGLRVNKFAQVLALLVAFVCGMYFQVALDEARCGNDRAAYVLDLYEGVQR